ncbi:MAG: SDR family NAD(P)-dependent oxidoreductase [Pirellulaceae bacterium]|nr:SDR family NAD(P)-dependent oxidoreductase [Pirellulaceae bacterium]
MQLSELFCLQGQVAVVTGGSRHLGYDIAEVLGQAGCDLVITSRQLDSAREAAERLQEVTQREVLPLALDLTDSAAIPAFMEQAWSWKGKVNVLVNNAGGGIGESPGHLFQRETQDIVDMISLNLTGPLLCCKAFSPKMAEQGSGKIINIASIAGILGRDRRMYEKNQMSGQPIEYAAAKAGIIGMTMDLAGLLTPLGVQVNSISPGGFGPQDKLPPGFAGDYGDRTPAGRMGLYGNEIKGAALYLASPASNYVSGHNLVVDGGFSIWH